MLINSCYKVHHLEDNTQRKQYVDNINNSELLKLIENGAVKMEYSIKYLKNVSVNKKYTVSNKIPEILNLHYL